MKNAIIFEATLATACLTAAACGSGTSKKGNDEPATVQVPAQASPSGEAPAGGSADALATVPKASANQSGTPVGDTEPNAQPTPSQPSPGDLFGNWIKSLGRPNGTANPATTTTATTPPAPTGSAISTDELRTFCLDSINAYRASVGAPAVTLNTAQTACVDAQAAADGGVGRAHANFGDCGEMAQDECPNYGTGEPGAGLKQCLSNMWREGPGGGHYDIMSSRRYTRVACGFARVNGKLWMVQDFYK